MNLLVFNPLYQSRVWGGRWLETALQRALPDDGPIGESWELVDRPEAQSVVAYGKYEGQTLRALLEKESAAIMGPHWDPAQPFPILVKWLDCQERLSLQVHPPAAIAPELGGEPKTENWFVVETKEGSAVLAGLEPGTTRAQFEQALRDGEAEPLVCRLPTQPGDSLFVESGRLHAIDGGNLILEIQQNSDTTYRVYDWGRVGLDGQPRQLHVDESLASIDFDDFSPALQASSNTPGQEKLVESEVFHLHRLNMTKGSPLNFAGGKQPRILSLVQGKLRETRTNETLLPGDNALIPYTGDHAFVAEETSVVLVTDHFVPLEA